MRRRSNAILSVGGATLLGVALLAAGCATDRPFDDFVEREIAALSAPPAAAPARPAAADEAPSPDALPSDAAVEDYIRLALERNPSLRAAQHRIEMVRARGPQVRSLADPVLMLLPTGEMSPGEGAGVMAGVSQSFPWPGKLDARGDAVEAEARAAEAELAAARLAVADAVRQAYWSRQLAAWTAEEVRRGRDLLAQVQSAVEAAYAAGTAEQQDVLRATVERSTLENELLTLAQQQDAAAAQLNALMDRPVTAPLPLPPPPPVRELDLRLDALLERAVADNPALAATRHRVDATRQRLRAARLERVPDLAVGVEYEEGSAMTGGDDQWWLTFAINLPIWGGKYDAIREEARRAVLAELADLHAGRNALAAQVHGLFVQVTTQQRLVRLFDGTLIPQAQQALDASLAGYRAGRVAFGEVVDNWQTLLEFRRMLHQSRAVLEQQLSQLEQTLGGELPPADEVN